MRLEHFPETLHYTETPICPGIIELQLGNPNTDLLPVNITSFTAVIRRLYAIQQDPDVRGVVLRFSGGFNSMELQELFKQAHEKAEFKKRLFGILDLMINLDKLRKPIVSIFDREMLGISYALTLLGDYSIAVADQARVGFPTGAYGVLYGLGSVVNLKAKVGISTAFEILTKGKIYHSAEALSNGMLDAHAANMLEAEAKAIEYILQWKTSEPENKASQVSVEEELQKINRQANSNIPAHVSCFIIFNTGEFLGKEEQLTMELVQFEYVLNCKETEAMVRTLYYGQKEAKAWPLTAGQQQENVLVLGAGMMGSGIAFEAAKAGFQVYLKDVDQAAAERGKGYAEKVSDKLIQLGKMDRQQQLQLLERIHPVAEFAQVPEQDIIIEAVFEDKGLKAEVIRASQGLLKPSGFFASNTTSLPITGLAKDSQDPQKFIGLHFFSPVDRMDLVEVIKGKETSAQTLDQAMQLIAKLQKVPIVVNDGPAFFTSRIFFNYLLEGITLRLEGVPVAKIDKLAKDAGFAVGPLAVLDEISLDLMLHVYDQLPKLHNSQRRAYAYLKKMIAQGRSGRRAGKGFYDYLDKTIGKQAWEDPDITIAKEKPSAVVIKYRLLHVVALDSYRCLDAGILSKPMDGDLGSILGLGYAVNTGGVFSHIDQVGIHVFVNDCLDFQKYGEQWEVPGSLIDLAKEDFKFYTEFQSNWN